MYDVNNLVLDKKPTTKVVKCGEGENDEAVFLDWSDEFWKRLLYVHATQGGGLFDKHIDVWENIAAQMPDDMCTITEYLLSYFRFFLICGLTGKRAGHTLISVRESEGKTTTSFEKKGDGPDCKYVGDNNRTVIFVAHPDMEQEDEDGYFFPSLTQAVEDLWYMYQDELFAFSADGEDAFTEAIFPYMMRRLLELDCNAEVQDKYEPEEDMPDPNDYMKQVWTWVKRGMALWTPEELHLTFDLQKGPPSIPADEGKGNSKRKKPEPVAREPGDMEARQSGKDTKVSEEALEGEAKEKFKKLKLLVKDFEDGELSD